MTNEGRHILTIYNWRCIFQTPADVHECERVPQLNNVVLPRWKVRKRLRAVAPFRITTWKTRWEHRWRFGSDKVVIIRRWTCEGRTKCGYVNIQDTHECKIASDYQRHVQDGPVTTNLRVRSEFFYRYKKCTMNGVIKDYENDYVWRLYNWSC